MADESPTRLSADQWSAMHIQLIAFTTQPQVVRSNLWKDLVGEEPEATSKKVAERNENGTWQGCALRLDVDPLRIVWTMAPALDLDSIQSGATPLTTLGPLGPIRDKFVGLMSQWLSSESRPEVNRLAFIGRLVQLTDAREEAYRRLNDYLPQMQLSPDSNDFQYRINRKRKLQTGLPGLMVNRLTTWHCVQFHFSVQARMGLDIVSDAIKMDSPFSCMLELDLNTDQEHKDPIDSSAASAVFQELAELGTEIAARGDVP